MKKKIHSPQAKPVYLKGKLQILNETVYEVQVSGTTRVMGLHAPPPVSNSKISLPSDLSESLKVVQMGALFSCFSWLDKVSKSFYIAYCMKTCWD